MTDLHITNGDGAANLLKLGPIEGDVLPWRDPMHHGPFEAGLDLASTSVLRANYLSGPGVDTAGAQRDFQLRDDHLRAASRYERVVLWFEHDLLDQLQLLQLLDWFSTADLGATKLELICINQFDGIEPFRGIGQLDADQLASLCDLRQDVTTAQLQLATEGWIAFCSSDPTRLEAFIKQDLSPLPFMKAALRRHLEEYPCHQTGLSRTEWQILKLVEKGVSAPGQLFLQNMDFETALFIGDWPTYRHISDLCGSPLPLLDCQPDGVFRHPPDHSLSQDAFKNQRLSLTETGRQVLGGDRDAFDLLARDQWLGGVNILSGRSMWTWDHARGSLRQRV